MKIVKTKFKDLFLYKKNTFKDNRGYFRELFIEKMIKRFTKKVKKEGIIAKVLEKRTHEKRSDKKRRLEKRRKKVLDKLKRKNEQKLHK